MPEMIQEAARQIPVRDSVDVLVCGGGLGGVAAAIASARAGARTLLVERNTFLGGTATAGMCCSMYNCFFTAGHKLGAGGIALEVADALAAAEGYGPKWRAHKGHIIYDCESGKQVLLELAEQAGATVLVDAFTVGALMEGNTLQGVILQSKSGREAIRAKVVVDATGDADVAYYAGAPLRSVERGLHSLCFRMGNVDVDAFVDYFRERPDQYPAYMDVDWSLEEALAQYDACGTFLFPHGGGIQMEAFQRAKADGALPSSVGMHDTTDACQIHALRRTGMAHVITGFLHFDGLSPVQRSRGIHDGRRMAFLVADVFRRYVPGFSRTFVAGTAFALGVRATRYLDGEFTFTGEMMQSGARVPDAVGRAVGWETLVKHPGPNAWAVGVFHEEPFEIPYRCLIPRRVDGLLMGAGRSVSAADPMLLRVMAHTMIVGQGAGTAAAVAARAGVSPRRVDIAAVQQELRRQGVALD